MTGNYRGGYGYRPIQIPPQKEQKGYDRDTEIVIPAIQALIVAWLCDVVGGLVLYLIVYIGPVPISTVLGGAIMTGTCIFVGFARISHQVKAPALAVGILTFAIQQYAFVKLAEVWPWAWRDPLTMWNAWVHTLWIGPLVGGGVLIWRFVNEIFDPFWPRLKEYPEPAKPERQSLLADRKMIVTKYANKEVAVEEEPVIEETWIPPVKPRPLRAHLVAFIVACAKRGTARKNWLRRGERYYLSTGRRVTRGTYDELMSILRGIGIFKRAGDGAGLEWLCEPREAIAIIEEQIDE